MKRMLATIAVVYAIAMGVTFIDENAFRYGSDKTANEGWFVTIPFSNHWCGYEIRGNTGPFCDSD